MEKNALNISIILIIHTLGFINYINAQSPALPFPQAIPYAAGTKPTTISNQDALDAYNIWKTNQVETCTSNGWVRVKYDNPAETVSEGIGYGMLLTAYHGDKTLFDGMWKYYLDHTNSNGVMDWKISGCTSTRLGNNGATDAELDCAVALLVAAKQFPTATSPYNYTNEAIALINKIKQYETKVVSGKYILKPGDQFGGENCSNASYYAPGYYRLFGKTVPADSTYWNLMARDAYVSMLANANATTGLVSDWQNAATGTAGDAGCGAGFNQQGKYYIYDACRTPWRFAMDYLWWGNTDGLAWLQKTTSWVNSLPGGGIAAVKDGYQQDGTVYGQYHNAPFVGAFAVAAMAQNQTMVNTFATDFKNINPQWEGYFGKSLRALYMLSLSGNFWLPFEKSSCNPSCAPMSVKKL